MKTLFFFSLIAVAACGTSKHAAIAEPTCAESPAQGGVAIQADGRVVSGVIVAADGRILTARSPIMGAKRLSLVGPQGAIPLALGESEEDIDLAVLVPTTPSATAFRPARVRKTWAITDGKSIRVLGPDGAKNGQIDRPLIGHGEFRHAFEVKADIVESDIGAAVVDVCGEVIGTIVSVQPEHRYGVAIPSEDAWDEFDLKPRASP